MKTIYAIAKEIQNVQIYPAITRVEPNDKVTKFLFNFNAETYAALISGANIDVTEVKNHKKFGEVISTFKIESVDRQPLTEFDRAVHAVCYSEFDAGNLYTTPNIIYRALTGKIGDSDANPSKDQRKAILKSVKKLMGTRYNPAVADAFEKLGYDKVVVKESMLLPCIIVDVTVNGQRVEDAIYFLCESPLWAIANAKDQIIRYNASLLDVPNLHNTPRVIMLKNYVMRRIQEIKLHKMTPTLTFADIFKKARITDASSQSKLDARKAVKIFFDHLQAKGVVKTFSLVKKANQFHAVIFTYNK